MAQVIWAEPALLYLINEIAEYIAFDKRGGVGYPVSLKRNPLWRLVYPLRLTTTVEKPNNPLTNSHIAAGTGTVPTVPATSPG